MKSACGCYTDAAKSGVVWYVYAMQDVQYITGFTAGELSTRFDLQAYSRNAQQVLNFFRFRLTSGRIEGMNSMISRVQLKTRGLPSVDYLRLKLRQLTSPSFTLLF